MVKENNFGDWIGPWLVQKITGQTVAVPVHSSPANPSVYLIGSIISQVQTGGVVWGSGIIKSGSNGCRPKGRPKEILSVRGPLSRQRLQQLRIPCPERYGDAAMVMPRYAPAPVGPKKYKLGIIPHFVDYGAVKASPIAQDPRVLVIDLKTRNIDHVLQQLWQCECTVSSSLHGLVVSVAYGIPTRWVELGNRLYGDQIKFLDFFLSLEPKERHSELMRQALAIVRARNNNAWSGWDKFPALEKYRPIDYRGRANAMTFDGLIAVTEKYNVTPSLLQDIQSSCPF